MCRLPLARSRGKKVSTDPRVFSHRWGPHRSHQSTSTMLPTCSLLPRPGIPQGQISCGEEEVLCGQQKLPPTPVLRGHLQRQRAHCVRVCPPRRRPPLQLTPDSGTAVHRWRRVQEGYVGYKVKWPACHVRTCRHACLCLPADPREPPRHHRVTPRKLPPGPSFGQRDSQA